MRVLIRIVFLAGLAFSAFACAIGPNRSEQGYEPAPAVQSNTTGPSAKTGSAVVRAPTGNWLYQNPTVGFALDFEPRWIVWARPEHMRADFRDSIAALEQNGQEVLLAAHLNNVVGLRVTTENVGVPAEDYATLIMDINKSEVEILSQQTVTMAGKTVVEWEAAHPSTGLIFVEYVLLQGTYDLRITFWTHPSLKERYQPEFRRIVSSYRSI